MAFETIREQAGRIIPRRRFAGGETNDPDDVIDVEEWGAAATPGLGERLRQSTRNLLIYGLGLIALVGILLAWARQFLLDIVTNPFVQGGVALAAIIGVSYLVGAAGQRSRITDSAWLVPLGSDRAWAYPGETRQATDGTEVFLPFRGFDVFGHKSRPLQLRELGDDLARTHAKAGRNPDDPARVRLDDARYEKVETAYGTFIVADTDGWGHDPFGQHSDVYLQPSSVVSEDNFRHQHQKLQTYVEVELPKLTHRITALQQEVENLRARLERDADAEIEQFLDRLERIDGLLRQPQSEQSGGVTDPGAEAENGHSDEEPPVGELLEDDLEALEGDNA